MLTARFFTVLSIALINCNTVYSQRYLTETFTILDSVIAGVYGTSINVQTTNQDLLFDFYSPANDPLAERPFILYIHGGGFTTGNRDYPSIQLMCRALAKKGYAVASIDYRLDPSFDIYNSNSDRRAMTDAMQDAKQAIRYFKANAATFRLDTTRLFIGGESAGAATALMASYIDKQSEMGSYPLANPNDPVGSSSNAGVGNGVAATLCLCGLLLDTLAIEAPTDPPMLWVHGTADAYVPIALAFNIVLRAANVGLPIQTRVYQGGVHCPWYFGNPDWSLHLDSVITDVTDFLYPLAIGPNAVQEVTSDQLLMKVYPNPTQSSTTLAFSSTLPHVNVAVYSQLGQKVQANVYEQVSAINLSLSNLPAGMYWIKVQSAESVVTRKIIKNR